MLPFVTKLKEWVFFIFAGVIGLFWLKRTLEKTGETRKQNEWEKKSLEHSKDVYEKATKARNEFKSNPTSGGEFLYQRGFIRDD